MSTLVPVSSGETGRNSKFVGEEMTGTVVSCVGDSRY